MNRRHCKFSVALYEANQFNFNKLVSWRNQVYVVVKRTVYLLTIYAKAHPADLTTAQRKAVLGAVAALKGE